MSEEREFSHNLRGYGSSKVCIKMNGCHWTVYGMMSMDVLMKGSSVAEKMFPENPVPFFLPVRYMGESQTAREEDFCMYEKRM